jgi:diaminohydroxyphosphoribosylaminopyrimidine deaminase/5-amino-6-(5-phosphoribosylamino)uracil reductase
MRYALDLARGSIGLASPNPYVGCVLTRSGETIGAGVHQYNLLEHAEVAAIKSAQASGRSTVGATAYVTLEPCSHHGRTPPCAEALIAAGIRRCVVATVDPNPLVAGRGIARLRDAGIAVEVGLLEAEARALNNAFACSITRARPFVTLKAALSVDGQLAPPASLSRTPNQPFWLTGPEARADVQRLRHASDAILTGIGTVLADDPALTDRSGLTRRRPLLRVVLDPQLRIPLTAKLLHPVQDDLWIFCALQASTEKADRLRDLGAHVIPVTQDPDASLDLSEILRHLHEARILSVLLEAGSALNGAFLKEQVVDRAILYFAESELGSDALPFAAGGPTPFALQQQFLSVEATPFGTDVRVSGLLQNPWPPPIPATD